MMRVRWLLAACLAVSGARAQMQLVAVLGSGEQPVGAAFNVGNVASSDLLDTRFRLRNNGSATATLASLSVGGTGFSLAAAPALPQLVLPGGTVEFMVRFEPGSTGSFSATLKADLTQTILRGTAFAAATVYLEEDGVRTPLLSGATVDFGSVERRSRAVRRFVFENRTGQVLVNPGIAVSSGGFRLLDAAVIEIAPGESVGLDVAFEPAAVAEYNGELRLDVRRILLHGIGLEIPLPKPEVTLDLGDQPPRSARQGKLGIRLAETARIAGTGRVRMEFRPGIAGVTADPAVLFANGARTTGFAVSEGDLSPLVIGFQTGTTAGTILFTAELGDYQEQASLVIPPEPVGIDSVAVSRMSSGLEVRVTGFDNTRSASQISFSFFDRSEAAVAPGAVRADVAAEFRKYFETPDLGGAFVLRAVFPVTGSPDQVAAVEVEMTNSAGASRSSRVRF